MITKEYYGEDDEEISIPGLLIRIEEIEERLRKLEKKWRKPGIIIPPADPPPDLGITDDD